MTEPLVTVVLPTKDRAQLLRRSVASVLGQTYQYIELIVVNDASSDTTREVLTEIQDPRLYVIHNERNVGASAARNMGIKKASGEFLAFQDDDDVWLPNKLEKQLEVLRAKPSSTWCICCNIRIQKGRARYIGGEKFISQLDFAEGAGAGNPDWSLIATPGWLVKTSLVKQVEGFDERIRSFDDWELGLRLSQYTKPVILDVPLWIQDWHLGSGLIRDEVGQANDLRIIMEEHGDVWVHRPDVRARHWRLIGRTLSLSGPSPAGRKELWASIRIRPLQPPVWLALTASYLGTAWNKRITSAIRRVRAWVK